MAYFDWHQQPGYYRDITRHFEPDSKVLDVGCGTAWLAQHFKNYTGIDASADAVEAASKAGRHVRQANLDDALPFPDASFEAVILKDVLEHLNDPVHAVREARRVLRPGGRLFASSPDAQPWAWDDYTHKRPYTRRAFKRLFADQGFHVDSVGYESVMSGSSVISRYTWRKRRPVLLQLAAWLPFVKRNVWILATR